MDLRRLWIQLGILDSKQNYRYLLQDAKVLEKLHLSVALGRYLVGLHDILSPISRTLKVLGLTISSFISASASLKGICDELEAMAGHYMLEALSIEFLVVDHESMTPRIP